MSDKLLIELNPPRLEAEPGAAPVQTVITLQNLGNVVEQYTCELVGLDQSWYTAPVSSVALFPQDRDQLHVSFHPPKRPGLRAGAYPFRIVVRSRGGGHEESVDGQLDVRGFAAFRIDITPRSLEGRRKGDYRILLANSGTADVRLDLSAVDSEEACKFRFPKDDSPLVPAGSKTEVPLVVQPKKRPWVGSLHEYQFTVNARPVDSRGDPQEVPARFTHRPFYPSWRPFQRAGFALAVVFVLFVIWNVAALFGVTGEVPRRWNVTVAQGGSWVCRLPLIGGMCSPDTMAARPLPTSTPEGCRFEHGFLDFAVVEGWLTGECTTNAAYDGFGNAIQYTRNGVLFWQKGSNTVYFMSSDSVYMRANGQTWILDGPGPQAQ